MKRAGGTGVASVHSLPPHYESFSIRSLDAASSTRSIAVHGLRARITAKLLAYSAGIWLNHLAAHR